MYTVALALLLAPDLPDLPDRSLPPDVYQTVKDISECLELFRRNGNWATDGSSELRWARNSLRRTWGSPPAADACWLPSVEFSAGALEFNEKFIEHLRARPTCHDDLTTVREEAQWLRCAWELAYKARQAGDDLGASRRALGALREMIGAEAYREGRLPPWVPVWRMSVVE